MKKQDEIKVNLSMADQLLHTLKSAAYIIEFETEKNPIIHVLLMV